MIAKAIEVDPPKRTILILLKEFHPETTYEIDSSIDWTFVDTIHYPFQRGTRTSSTRI